MSLRSVDKIARALAAEQTDRQIADTLNARWLRSGTRRSFTRLLVRVTREAYAIPSLAEQLRAAGWLTSDAIAAQLGVHHTTAKRFASEGVLCGRRADDAGRIRSSCRPARRHEPTRASVSVTAAAIPSVRRTCGKELQYEA